VASIGAAIAVGGANQPREETDIARRPLGSARKNAVNHISSAPSWQPGYINQVKTVGASGGRLRPPIADSRGATARRDRGDPIVATRRQDRKVRAVPGQNSTSSSAAITRISPQRYACCGTLKPCGGGTCLRRLLPPDRGHRHHAMVRMGTRQPGGFRRQVDVFPLQMLGAVEGEAGSPLKRHPPTGIDRPEAPHIRRLQEFDG
jgi:hypothetical protein